MTRATVPCAANIDVPWTHIAKSLRDREVPRNGTLHARAKEMYSGSCAIIDPLRMNNPTCHSECGQTVRAQFMGLIFRSPYILESVV